MIGGQERQEVWSDSVLRFDPGKDHKQKTLIFLAKVGKPLEVREKSLIIMSSSCLAGCKLKPFDLLLRNAD